MTDAHEELSRREFETFRTLADAMTRIHELLHRRLQFPGEGRVPDPLDAEAVADLHRARDEAERAYHAWRQEHDALTADRHP